MATKPKSTRGGRGGASATLGTSFTSTQGTHVDLPSGYPLKYGKKDPNISDAQRKKIEEFESRRVKNKTEYAFLTDSQGNAVGEYGQRKGGTVRTPTTAYQKAESFTHIHPRGKREDGALGGTFSADAVGGDLQAFTQFPNVKTMRAAAAEGTYSISKLSNFNSQAFMSYATAQYNKTMDVDYRAELKSLDDSYTNGNMTYSEYTKAYIDAFNKASVNWHNALLAGQKKYGYYYTLERR